MLTVNTRLHENFSKCSKFLTGIVLLISLSVIIEWEIGYSIFRRPIPNSVSTNPLTALLFIIIGISFYLLTAIKVTRVGYNMGKLLLIVAICASLLKLASLFPAFTFHIDQIIFSDQLKNEVDSVVPNKMATIAAICFLILCNGLFFLSYAKTQRFTWPIQIVLLVTFISLFFLLGL